MLISNAMCVSIAPIIMYSPSFSDLTSRIKSEYIEMPGLWLTAAQAARLWALEPRQCEQLLLTLVDQRFLVVRSDGKYGRLATEFSAVRSSAKASLNA